MFGDRGPASAQAKRRNAWRTHNVWTFSLGSMFSDWGHEMVTALMPGFLAALGAPPIALGVTEGVSNLVQAWAAVWGGRVSDRDPRRHRVLIAGYTLTGLKALIAAVYWWPWVVVLRTVGWAGRGARGPIRDAYIAEEVAQDQVGKAYGLREAFDTGRLIGTAERSDFRRIHHASHFDCVDSGPGHHHHLHRTWPQTASASVIETRARPSYRALVQPLYPISCGKRPVCVWLCGSHLLHPARVAKPPRPRAVVCAFSRLVALHAPQRSVCDKLVSGRLAGRPDARSDPAGGWIRAVDGDPGVLADDPGSGMVGSTVCNGWFGYRDHRGGPKNRHGANGIAGTARTGSRSDCGGTRHGSTVGRAHHGNLVDIVGAKGGFWHGSKPGIAGMVGHDVDCAELEGGAGNADLAERCAPRRCWARATCNVSSFRWARHGSRLCNHRRT